MIEGKLNKKRTLFSPVVLICTVHYPWLYPKIEAINVNIDETAGGKLAFLVVRSEISGENRINFQLCMFFQYLCSSRDVACKLHVSEKEICRQK